MAWALLPPERLPKRRERVVLARAVEEEERGRREHREPLAPLLVALACQYVIESNDEVGGRELRWAGGRRTAG